MYTNTHTFESDEKRMRKKEKKTPNTKRSFTLRCTIFPAIRSLRVDFFYIHFNIVVVSVTVPPFHYICIALAVYVYFLLLSNYEARFFSSSDFLFALLPSI